MDSPSGWVEISGFLTRKGFGMTGLLFCQVLRQHDTHTPFPGAEKPPPVITGDLRVCVENS
jgi:hypothetical protein